MAGRQIKKHKDIYLKIKVGLDSESARINQELDQISWHSRDIIARKIINSLSIDELRQLPVETRLRLQTHLTAGRISESARRAISKLSAAELVEIEYQRRIVLKGSREFVETTRKHLSNLNRLLIGKRLFRSLLRSNKLVTIVQTDRVSEAPPDDFKSALAKGSRLKWRNFSGGEKTIVGSGDGSNTTIKYNPDLIASRAAENWRKMPPEIGLAHELIHANDAAYGQLDPGMTEGVRNYERQAVGLPPYEDKEFTENKFRAAWPSRLSARTKY